MTQAVLEYRTLENPRMDNGILGTKPREEWEPSPNGKFWKSGFTSHCWWVYHIESNKDS